MSPTTIRIGDGCNRQNFVHTPDILSRCDAVPVARQLYVKGLGQLATDSPYSIARPKGSGDYVLLFSSTGTARLMLNQECSEIHNAQILLIRPDQPHVFESITSNPWNFYWLHFSGELAEEYADMLQLDESCPLQHIGNTDDWIRQFQILFNIISKGVTDQELVEGSVQLAQLLSLTGNLRRNNNRKSRHTEQRIQQSIEFMNRNFTKSITLENMAEKACLSVPQYGALFRKYTGTSPARYLREIRLRRACEQLKNTALPVSSISQEVGFDDPYYFSRLFKRNIGTTPTEFRKRSII